MPVDWLSTTAGVHVPLKPLLEVDGNEGGASPAQIGGKELNTGENIGSESTTPVETTVVLPLSSNIKPVYKPLFRLVMVICPAPFVTRVTGPIVTPSSI